MNLTAHKAAIFTQVAGGFILFGTADCLITQSEFGFQQDSALFDEHTDLPRKLACLPVVKKLASFSVTAQYSYVQEF